MSLLKIYKQSDGTEPTTSNALGLNSFLLTSATRYIIGLAGSDYSLLGAHVQWDATIVITSITVEDCSLPIEAFASDAQHGLLSTTAGVWIKEIPTTSYVGTDIATGVTITNGSVAVAGGTQSGCHFHVVDTSAARTRLNILVGTGGVIRFGGNVKKK